MKFLKKIIKEEIRRLLNETGSVILQKGSSGKKVIQLQQLLKALGYGKLLGPQGVDGKFGNNTQAAVKDFQEDNDISRTDGVVDEETMQKLTKKYGEMFLKGATAFTMLDAGNVAAQTQKQKQLAPTQCQQISGTEEQKQNYKRISLNFIKADMPLRSACEMAFIKIRPQYAGKAFFIVDTKDKVIFLYDKDNNYVAKSGIVSGKNAQSQNEEMIANALKSGFDIMKEKGYEFNKKDNSYYKDGKKIDSETAYWEYLRGIDKMKTRFIPKGVYNIAYSHKDKHEVGADTGDNAFRLRLGDKILNQAIHGFFKDQKRFEWFAQAKKKYDMDSNNPAIKKEYLDFIRSNVGKFQGGYGSFGCINVSLEFLIKMRPYAIGANVFVLGEQNENYLVQNSKDFFEKSYQTEDIQQYASAYPAKLEINIPQQPGQEQKAYV